MRRWQDYLVRGALVAMAAGGVGCGKQQPAPTPPPTEAPAAAPTATPAPTAEVVAEPAMPPPKATFAVPPDAELKVKLTPLQWHVVRENGTEPPFANEHWQNLAPGLYVCVVSGKPLFSSAAKLQSSSGWPTFSAPIDANELVTRPDTSEFLVRTEVRTKTADTHVGHVFDDGPEPTRRRWVVNSAALRFIPRERLLAEGYGDYAALVGE